jgi:hypothetical protein
VGRSTTQRSRASQTLDEERDDHSAKTQRSSGSGHQVTRPGKRDATTRMSLQFAFCLKRLVGHLLVLPLPEVERCPDPVSIFIALADSFSFLARPDQERHVTLLKTTEQIMGEVPELVAVF